MANVFTTGSTVLCGVAAPKLHGGKVKTTSTAKLTIGMPGQAVLVASSLTTVSGCANAPPPMGATPCSTVTSVLPASVAAKLQVNGTGVLIESLKGVTVGTPPGDLSGSSAGQTKLTAI